MIYEVISTQFDIQKLRNHLNDFVLTLDPIQQSEAFGGWSVLSSDRSYKDGWHMGQKLFTQKASHDEILNQFQSMGMKRTSEYIFPTEICHGYLATVINEIKVLGFNPRRARIIKLTAGFASTWHRDNPDHIQAVRLHVPIKTNSECFFEIETERSHMPATGQSYLVRVNRLHRVVNYGETDRFHLVMDVVDHKGISQYHRPKI